MISSSSVINVSRRSRSGSVRLLHLRVCVESRPFVERSLVRLADGVRHAQENAYRLERLRPHLLPASHRVRLSSESEVREKDVRLDQCSKRPVVTAFGGSEDGRARLRYRGRHALGRRVRAFGFLGGRLRAFGCTRAAGRTRRGRLLASAAGRDQRQEGEKGCAANPDTRNSHSLFAPENLFCQSSMHRTDTS